MHNSDELPYNYRCSLIIDISSHLSISRPNEVSYAICGNCFKMKHDNDATVKTQLSVLVAGTLHTDTGCNRTTSEKGGLKYQYEQLFLTNQPKKSPIYFS